MIMTAAGRILLGLQKQGRVLVRRLLKESRDTCCIPQAQLDYLVVDLDILHVVLKHSRFTVFTVLYESRKDSRTVYYTYYTCVKKPRVKTLSNEVLPASLHVGEWTLKKWK